MRLIRIYIIIIIIIIITIILHRLCWGFSYLHITHITSNSESDNRDNRRPMVLPNLTYFKREFYLQC